MIFVLFKRLFQVLVLAALQVLILNQIHLLGYATPMPYVLFLVWLPLNSNRVGNLLWAFLLGLIIDVFSNTPGEASASMTLAALVQWPLLHASAPKDCVEDMVPTYASMGRWNHSRYIIILTLVHHALFFLLESFSFFHYRDLLISFAASLALSVVLMLTFETLRHGK